MTLTIRRAGDRIQVGVRVTPRAAANAVGGARDGLLSVRVTAPAVEGRANAALIAGLARALDVARSDIRIERGGGARTKVVSLPAASRARLVDLAR